MFSVDNQQGITNHVKEFYELIDSVWDSLCDAYDISAAPPMVKELFEGVDFSSPESAARSVIVNMLSEIIENAHRFSPWYTSPASAFGLTRTRVPVLEKLKWRLAPEAAHRWRRLIAPLSREIENKSGLIQAVVFIDQLEISSLLEGIKVKAHCGCIPPRGILVNPQILEKSKVVCDACCEVFSEITAR